MVCLQDAILFLEETQNKKMCGLPSRSKGTIGGRKREKQGGGKNNNIFVLVRNCPFVENRFFFVLWRGSGS